MNILSNKPDEKLRTPLHQNPLFLFACLIFLMGFSSCDREEKFVSDIAPIIHDLEVIEEDVLPVRDVHEPNDYSLPPPSYDSILSSPPPSSPPSYEECKKNEGLVATDVDPQHIINQFPGLDPRKEEAVPASSPINQPAPRDAYQDYLDLLAANNQSVEVLK